MKVGSKKLLWSLTDRKRKIIISILFGLLLFENNIYATEKILDVSQLNQAPVAIEGILDLRSWNFQKEIVPLQGEWEFYWQKYSRLLMLHIEFTIGTD